jgi:hypothetical protein
MRASIAWCVIPVPVSPVVAYRSPWSERRLRSLVSPIRGFYGIRASSVFLDRQVSSIVRCLSSRGLVASTVWAS